MSINPPVAMVKSPRSSRLKQGRGFSISEIKAVNLTINEARLLGIPIDARRKSTWEWNVKALQEYISKVINAADASQLPLPSIPKRGVIKPKRGMAFRGITPAGRRARGLLSVGLRETHKYKWRRKQRQREFKLRHEVAFRKGGA
ncbi:ribosomal protein L13e [Caldivirga sp. UBA161]|uniref:ribosomal protein L13e n=1 Tax=Caldivirga sp. UBA161 TaxID=1915569 RepID=UPI0025B95E47|nr:ribosomal protein L13e [Caldivirga sp. UBA161]